MCARECSVRARESAPPPPPELRLYAAVLQQRLLAFSPAALRAVGVTLRSVVVLLIGASPHAGPGVLRDEQGHQQRQQHRARTKQEGRTRDDGTLRTRQERLFKSRYDMWRCWVLLHVLGYVYTGGESPENEKKER